MFRFFEMILGILSWGTLICLVVLSWQLPSVVVIFIVLYDLYWLLRSVYLFFHLRFSFKQLRENEKVDWFRRVRQLDGWESVYHLIILPMREEPHELVRETFSKLLLANYPKDKLLVTLATEERTGEKDAETARRIEEEFGKSFKSFLITKHPANITEKLSARERTKRGRQKKRWPNRCMLSISPPTTSS